MAVGRDGQVMGAWYSDCVGRTEEFALGTSKVIWQPLLLEMHLCWVWTVLAGCAFRAALPSLLSSMPLGFD